MDFNSLAQSLLPNSRTLIEQWIPGGKIQGPEYIVKNPTRPDSQAGSFKINITTGLWSDFATGDSGGDLISLYAFLHKIKNIEAARILSDMPVSSTPPHKPELKIIDKWEIVSPVPKNAPALPVDRIIKNKNGFDHFKINHYWPYKNQIGDILFYVVRYEKPDGKETPPMTLCKNQNGKLKWRFKGIDGKKPLYNLDKIAHSPDAQVVVVEGEKKAEALQALVESNNQGGALVATCWVGGCGGVLKADWSPLRNKKIILWPDNDDVGREAMGEVMSAVGPSAKYLMIKIPDDKPKAWDVADAILKDAWNFQQVLSFIKQNKFTPVAPPAPEKPPEPEPEPSAVDEPPAGPSTDPSPEPEIDIKYPFKLLGFLGEFCYYLPAGTRQVMAIKRSQHGSGELIALAPLAFWEHNYPGKQGPVWRVAANDVIRSSEQAGIYDPDKQRGRGAWYDKGRAVLHLGNRLMVDGQEVGLSAMDTRYIYEAATPLDHQTKNSLTKKEANRLQQISDRLFWEKPIYSKLFSGWCVCACICGALRYRPHLWLTSKPGAGKTFIIESIMRPILGDFAISLSSDTTEAGIRQTLSTDALAVIIDEFEGEDFYSQQRIQAILKLARQAFSDNGARIVKGGQNHKATSFKIRSSFFMSSVGVNIQQHADETRISVLSLESPFDRPRETKKEHFQALNRLLAETITDDWCSAFRLRAIRLIPVIRKNIEVFTLVVSGKIGNRRSGDQVGPLLAGAYSLVSDSVITTDAAQSWVDAQDWGDQTAVAEKTDERICLNHIIESIIPGISGKETSIAELLEYVQTWTETYQGEKIEYTPELKTLKRYGVTLDRDEGILFISDSHRSLKRLLKDTPWPKSWGRLLKRIPGAFTRPCSFHGYRSFATGIPWCEVMGSEPVQATEPVQVSMVGG